jgi:hypothetical protein
MIIKNNFYIKFKIKILHFVMISSLLIFVSCNAPRNNPLDPGNPGYSLATLEGSAFTFSTPYTGISDVTVYWSPSNMSIKTDINGNFKFANILPENGKLIFQKTGYLSDTVDVIWGNSKYLKYVVNLNQIPKLESISIYSVVLNQYTPPGQTYQLIINSKISNKDNNIDTVFVENSQLNLKKALSFNASNKDYAVTLTTQDLNVSDIEQTIGLNFNIIVKDTSNRQYNIGNDKVTRIIKSGVAIQFPANDTTVSSTPFLQWQRFKAGYPFTYMIEIYTNHIANSQLVYSKNNISSDSTSYFVNVPLSTNNYYWIIWVVDQFNNKSRSLPATFRVP